MKNLLTVLVVVVLSVAFVGCCGRDCGKEISTQECLLEGKICVKCGEIEGTSQCCDKNAPRCEKCGLIKGSVACCKPELLGKTLCVKCGELKESDKCDKKDAIICEKCGAFKGSPGCCKESFKEYKEIIFDNDESDL